jgi:hypothetical protein
VRHGGCSSRTRPIAHVGRDLGIAPETLRKYVRRVEADEGRRRDVLSSEEREEMKKLRRENFELRRANEIPHVCWGLCVPVLLGSAQFGPPNWHTPSTRLESTQ